MFEVKKNLVDCLQAFLGELPIPGGEWLPAAVLAKCFTRLEKKNKPLLRKQAGQACAALYLEELKACYVWESVREALAHLPKVYSHFLKGSGAGVWISEELSEGYLRVRENTPFDCFFTEGLLGGLLTGLGARGAVVKHTDCRKDGEAVKFCRYELVWMKNVRR